MSKGKRPCIYIVRDFLLAFDGARNSEPAVEWKLVHNNDAVSPRAAAGVANRRRGSR